MQIKVDPGGEKYVSIAKKWLKTLESTRKDLRLPVMQKKYQIDSATLVQLVSSDTGDRIRISGGTPFAQLVYVLPDAGAFGAAFAPTGPAKVLPPRIAGERPLVYMKNPSAWGGSVVVRAGRSYGSLPTPTYATSLYSLQGYTPDGRAYVVTDVDAPFNEENFLYPDHLAFVRVHELVFTPPDSATIETTDFSWFDSFDPLLDAAGAGLSSWVDSGGHREGTTFFTPTVPRTPPDADFPAASYDAEVRIAVSRWHAFVSYQWVDSTANETSYPDPNDPSRSWIVKSRVIGFALDSKYTSLGLSRPTPGELVQVLDTEYSAELWDFLTGGDSTGDLAEVFASTVSAAVTSAGSRIATVGVTEADSLGVRAETFLNNTLVDTVPSSATPTDGGIPTDYDAMMVSGQEVFRLPSALRIDVGDYYYTMRLYWGSEVREYGEHFVTGIDDPFATVLRGGEYVLAPSSVDGTTAIFVYSPTGDDLGFSTQLLGFSAIQRNEDVDGAFFAEKEIPFSEESPTPYAQIHDCRIASTPEGLVLTITPLRKAPQTLTYDGETSTPIDDENRGRYTPFAALPGYRE